jgi:O-antigen/teichoic acid export membrane protein
MTTRVHDEPKDEEHGRGQLVRNIGSTLVTRIAVLLIALPSSVVLARLLGPEGRGVFALILLLPGLAASLGLLGFEQANAVYAGLVPRGRGVLLWQSAAIAAGVGGAVAAIGTAYVLAGAPGFEVLASAPPALVLLMLATIPVRLLVDYWSAIVRGMNRIHVVNVLEIGMKVTGLLGILILVWGFDLGVAGAAWSDAAASIAAVVFLGGVLGVAGVWCAPTWDARLWRRVTAFALAVHAGTIAAYLNYRVDEFIIAALLPVEQLGLYAIAVGLVERIWIIPGSVATVLLPHLTNRRGGDAAVSAVICRHVAMWTAVTCGFVYVVADPLVTILFSPSFAGAVAPLRWLLPGILTLSIGKVLVGELLARERARYTVFASGAAVVANVAGNLLLVPRMGISGAALASSVSYTILSGTLTWYYLRVTGLRWTVLVPCAEDLSAYRAAWRRLISDR